MGLVRFGASQVIFCQSCARDTRILVLLSALRPALLNHRQLRGGPFTTTTVHQTIR